ncbi:MAG: hypothetical protein J0L66_18900 [Cytophagales bacterium]|nr:hypothetical protein [Cytophagales bacterium]
MKVFLTTHHFKIGRDAMFDLLADRGLLVTKRKRRGPVTTLSKHRFKKYPNIVGDFIPIAPNQLWVSDITYIHLAEGFANAIEQKENGSRQSSRRPRHLTRCASHTT